LIKVQLDEQLNKTESNQVYASYWPGQNFLVTNYYGSRLDYTLLGMSIITIIVIVVMFPYQQARLRQLQVIVFAMQTTQTRLTAVLDFLVLRTTAPPSVQPVISQVDVMIDFTNEYWFMLLALALGLVAVYKQSGWAFSTVPTGSARG